jgi:hypothetical protein
VNKPCNPTTIISQIDHAGWVALKCLSREYLMIILSVIGVLSGIAAVQRIPLPK